MMINGASAIEWLARWNRGKELAQFAREMGNVTLAQQYEDRASEALDAVHEIMAAAAAPPVDNSPAA